MTHNEIRSAVIRVVSSIQQASGRPTTGISGSTCPLGDLNGFDSLNCVEASGYLSVELGCNIGQDVGLFAQKGTGRTIDEIATEIEKIMSEKGE